MATFVKFNKFVLHLGNGEHVLQASGDTIMVYLTNTTPDVVNHILKSNLAGITEQNGYAVADIQNDFSEGSGIGTLVGVDVEWTATTGGFGPFRYAVLYNSTATTLTNPLICYWDYGSQVTCNVGEKFKVDFGASILTLT